MYLGRKGLRGCAWGGVGGVNAFLGSKSSFIIRVQDGGNLPHVYIPSLTSQEGNKQLHRVLPRVSPELAFIFVYHTYAYLSLSLSRLYYLARLFLYMTFPLFRLRNKSGKRATKILIIQEGVKVSENTLLPLYTRPPPLPRVSHFSV